MPLVLKYFLHLFEPKWNTVHFISSEFQFFFVGTSNIIIISSTSRASFSFVFQVFSLDVSGTNFFFLIDGRQHLKQIYYKHFLAQFFSFFLKVKVTYIPKGSQQYTVLKKRSKILLSGTNDLKGFGPCKFKVQLSQNTNFSEFQLIVQPTLCRQHTIFLTFRALWERG